MHIFSQLAVNFGRIQFYNTDPWTVIPCYTTTTKKINYCIQNSKSLYYLNEYDIQYQDNLVNGRDQGPKIMSWLMYPVMFLTFNGLQISYVRTQKISSYLQPVPVIIRLLYTILKLAIKSQINSLSKL